MCVLHILYFKSSVFDALLLERGVVPVSEISLQPCQRTYGRLDL